MRKQALILWEKIRNEPLLAALSGTFILLLVLFLLTMILEDPKWIYRYLGLPKKNDALKFLGIGMGGVLLALQALMSYKRAKALEDTANAQAEAAKAQAKATEEQAKANQNTEQGQRQERLKNAIEHLGHEKDSVRLGGAYELFHLAEETEKWRQTILDILCAHIRQTTGEDEYRKKYKLKPSEEIQSLLTLLFVQEHEVFKGLRINLQGSWLNEANLNGAQLEHAVMVGTYLQRTELENSCLRDANFTGARLTLANLQKADLHEANFCKAHLQNACLNVARLQGARLYRVQMQGVTLLDANLRGAFLWEAQMQAADLCGARLQLATLSDVGLQAARIEGAQLQAANLHGVQLGGAESMRPTPVETHLRSRIGEQGSLVGVIVLGGLSEQDVDSILEDVSQLKDMSYERLSVSRAGLNPHIGRPESHQLPSGSSVDLDAYTAEEAEKWIAEYEEAMSEVPEDAN